MNAPVESLLYRCVLGRRGGTDNNLSAMHLIADRSIARKDNKTGFTHNKAGIMETKTNRVQYMCMNKAARSVSLRKIV